MRKRRGQAPPTASPTAALRHSTPQPHWLADLFSNSSKASSLGSSLSLFLRTPWLLLHDGQPHPVCPFTEFQRQNWVFSPFVRLVLQCLTHTIFSVTQELNVTKLQFRSPQHFTASKHSTQLAQPVLSFSAPEEGCIPQPADSFIAAGAGQ